MHKKFLFIYVKRQHILCRRVNKSLKIWFLICIKLNTKSIQFWISDQKAHPQIAVQAINKEKN